MLPVQGYMWFNYRAAQIESDSDLSLPNMLQPILENSLFKDPFKAEAEEKEEEEG